MPVYKAEGIVVRQQALGEADRVVTLFTREYGKLRAAARGVRRTTSRLGGRVEPFTHARFLLAKGKTLDVIAQVDVVEAFGKLRAGLLRSAYAAYVAELVDRFLPDRDRHESVFTLVRTTLAALAEATDDDAELVSLWFALRLATDLGYRPETDACVGCGTTIATRRASSPARRSVVMKGPAAGSRGAPGEPAAWAFSPALGGALCPACAAGQAGEIRVLPGVLAACAHLVRLPATQVRRLRIPPGERGELARLIQAHLEYQLEAKLRAPLVIERLRGPRDNGSP